jgi:SAM-dependent methyltransferase
MSILIHKDSEQENFEKYSGSLYDPETITHLPQPDSKGFSDQYATIRVEIIKRFVHSDAVVLDLCCGTGEVLLHFANQIRFGYGLDFSAPFIERANHTLKEQGATNIQFNVGNARKMEYDDNFFDLVFSLSALYHIPNVGEVITEISRTLKPGGHCVVDLGNLYSLNTVVCKSHPELAYPYHIPVPQMRNLMKDAGLEIIEHRKFQILPMWANRPKWMRPLLWPGWVGILTKQVGGRMLDEGISSLPLLRQLAFRHLFICCKK